MKRLTLGNGFRHNPGCIYDDCYNLLADLEDAFGDTYDPNRIMETAKADRDRRCVTFKFGLGSTVYRLWVRPNGSGPFISEEKMNTVQDLVNAESWANAYSTREAADVALAELKGVE